MNETFWDAQILEIEACTNFDDFPDPEKLPSRENIWGLDALGQAEARPRQVEAPQNQVLPSDSQGNTFECECLKNNKAIRPAFPTD